MNLNRIPASPLRGLAQTQQAVPVATPATLLQRRASRARELMLADNLDALVVFGRGHITEYGDAAFLTGYAPVARMSYAVLTRSGRGPVLVAPTPADRWYAARLPDAPEVRLAGEGDVVSGRDDLASAAAAVLAEERADRGRIGITGLRGLLPVGEFDALRRALPDAELVDAGSLMSRLKLLKEDEDVAEIRRTVAIADAGFIAARQALRPGATEAEVGAAIYQAVFSRGTRDALIFASAQPYFLSWTTDRPFRNGDLATIYVEIVGPTGYWVEVGGMVALGTPEPEQLRVAEACLEAARRAEAHLRPGSTAGEVARSIDGVAAEEDLHSGLWHGHGIGVDHDSPVITAADDTPLAPGMVIAVHPNFSTADERFGASVVDTYLITDDGFDRLSAVPQEILR
ncbi:M24 family metallopeptidase [Capillimicrobium parvum]|uniref:Methionine aminopeptidase 1, mitochondrial n=1 Tax=Capillimicrobium parvum TaxID=2884022 RepID=A0A9E7BYW5_9ACTN|nr:Xaa-Pro peptidase family protein [Capillimicrobium parvum]UGS33853.1 Methionine aminopeptidase 1, mitochondrial [Capillimicrobium parvum]